jgi:hypothetical protein
MQAYNAYNYYNATIHAPNQYIVYTPTYYYPAASFMAFPGSRPYNVADSQVTRAQSTLSANAKPFVPRSLQREVSTPPPAYSPCKGNDAVQEQRPWVHPVSYDFFIAALEGKIKKVEADAEAMTVYSPVGVHGHQPVGGWTRARSSFTHSGNTVPHQQFRGRGAGRRRENGRRDEGGLRFERNISNNWRSRRAD